MARVDPVAWAEAFNEMFALIAGEFAEVRTRRRGRGYLLGLLSQSERKNGWTIAEFAGDSSPDGMQRLLNLHAWDADRVRDALARHVVRAMGDAGAVLVADETGFLKRAACRRAWPGNIPARRAGWRTVRSGCFWLMPRRTARGR